MTPTDYVLVGVAAALWAAVVWHRTQARAVGELWWSCVCLAAIVSLKIGVIADPFNQLTGGVYLDELLGHLLGVTMAALTLSWLVLIRYGSRRPQRRLRLGGTAIVLSVLVVTWFSGPIYDIPATEDWIPEAVLDAPVLVVHWLIFTAYLLAFAVVFAVMAGGEARRLPPGYVRQSLSLLIGAAGLLTVCFGASIVGQFVRLAGGDRPAWLYTFQNALLAAIFALFLLAIAIPLARGPRSSRPSSQDTDARVASLWRWISQAGDDAAEGSQANLVQAGPESLFDQVVDIRDRMWQLQRYLGPEDLAAAGRQARAQGLLFGARARAHATAACLELAARRRADNAHPVPPPPANLAGLGGGRTIDQEAYWLAAVADALSRRLNTSIQPSF